MEAFIYGIVLIIVIGIYVIYDMNKQIKNYEKNNESKNNEYGK